MILPGWTCQNCGVFNGEVKEKLFRCRSCNRAFSITTVTLERAKSIAVAHLDDTSNTDLYVLSHYVIQQLEK